MRSWKLSLVFAATLVGLGALPAGTSVAHAKDVELDAAVHSALGPVVLVGLGLTDRATLMAGISGARLRFEHGERVDSFAFPLELKLYLSALDEASVVPLVRLGVVIGGLDVSQDEFSYKRLLFGMLGMAGATYFVNEHFGISAETGLLVGRSWEKAVNGSTSDLELGVSVAWNLGLVLRT